MRELPALQLGCGQPMDTLQALGYLGPDSVFLDRSLEAGSGEMLPL